MKQTPAYLIEDVLSPDDRQCLLEYLAHDDDRTDSRPDVRSKHPRWGESGWPQQIVDSAMTRAVGPGFVVEEVTFRQDQIGLQIHTDNDSPPRAVGKTIMLLLDAEPVAHTVFFKNYSTVNEKFGTFFTKSAWNPYAYKLKNRKGELTRIPDLRILLDQCETDPAAVTEFDVTDEFIDCVRTLVHKRSLPKLDLDQQTPDTGYMQPAKRVHDYSILTGYCAGQPFDLDAHAQYLSDIPLSDLEGLTLDSVLEWQIDGAIVFDRNQLHCSSSTHKQKSFVTVFYHHPS